MLTVPGISFAESAKADTARLTAQLFRIRQKGAKYSVSASEYQSVRAAYQAWIDARLQAGIAPETMNDELRRAKLFLPGSLDIGDRFNSYAGFLGEIEIRSSHGADDVLILTFSFNAGINCNSDETVLVYQRTPLRLIAAVNGQKAFTHGYILEDFDIGREDRGIRVAASAWTFSRCTSNWGGHRFRIDLTGPRLENLLDHESVGGFGFDTQVRVAGNIATFEYRGSLADPKILVRDGIMRFRVGGNEVIRQPPIARSYASFIGEWLAMDDTESSRWSSLQAQAYHKDLASRKESFEFDYVADCADSPAGREIGVRWESGSSTIFRIAGTRAPDMRMVSVSSQRSSMCHQSDVMTILESALKELPME